MATGTTFLGRGSVLTVTTGAGSTATVRRLAQSGSTTQYALTEISASATVTFGPFPQDRQYEVLSTAGSVTYSSTESDQVVTALQKHTAMAVNGAAVIQPGTVVFTKAGVLAATLAAPTAAEAGTRMTFVAGTANAHTLTATGLIDDGVTGGSKDLATFAAFVGASLTLEAYNLKWVVISNTAVTIT